MNLLMQELERSPRGDAKALMVIDERFHELLYQAANDELLADTPRRSNAQSLRIWHLQLDRLCNVRLAREQHVAVAEAVSARNGELAASLVQAHISEFREHIKASL